MASIKLEDDCLAPNMQVVIRFEGPNPYAIYPKIKSLMKDIWEVESIAYWEREFRWDASSDPREFVIRCYIDKGLDRFTRVLIEVFIQGWQPADPTKTGKVEIRIGGVLRTTFGGNTVLDDAKNPLFKMFFWAYNKYFYSNQRRYYIREWCYNRIQILKGEIQKILNIAPPQKL